MPTHLHSGIELRRTSHKAAEQKRRDSLKHCFDDLRHMIPNIVDKSPSKVFLLKKSFDYICSLKAELAQRDLAMARMQAQQEFFQQNLKEWFVRNQDGGGGVVPEMEGWKMSEEMLDQATRRELEIAHMAAEMAEQSATAVEAARIGNQPGGGGGNNKGGNKTGASGSQTNDSSTIATGQQQHRQKASSSSSRGQIDSDDEDEDDDDSTPTASRRSSTIAPNSSSSTTSSSSVPSNQSSSLNSTIHPLSGASVSSSTILNSVVSGGDIQMTSSTQNHLRLQTRSKSSRSDDEDEDDDDEEEEDDEDDEDYEGDQEMRAL
ncbi:hypothetical protein BGX24_008007 [Mortierella sp. AD032]|nr:hypothetical protein BGX24_008007 [Mortierella sp. AD032]